RRRAPRLRAEDVPWIVTVRVGYGNAGRLVDISRTGLLLETSDRLRPGQRGLMTFGLEGNRSEQVASHIVRSNLVALARDGKPLYRAAFLFEEELTSRLLVPASAPVDDTIGESSRVLRSRQLNGPFDALWATEAGWEFARVTNLDEIGCLVHMPVTVAAG